MVVNKPGQPRQPSSGDAVIWKLDETSVPAYTVKIQDGDSRYPSQHFEGRDAWEQAYKEGKRLAWLQGGLNGVLWLRRKDGTFQRLLPQSN